MDYTAKVRAKGLDNTGVTEKIASEWHSHLGSFGVAIVEFKIVRASNDDDGKHKVELTIEHFEPAVNTDLDEHLRGITRALHTNRVLHSDGDQLTIDGQDDLAPKVSDLILAGQSLFPDEDDEGEQDDPAEDETWEYPEGEGSDEQPASGVPNPFTVVGT